MIREEYPVTFDAAAEFELDTSLIGPLSKDRIEDGPISWNAPRPTFLSADKEADEFVAEQTNLRKLRALEVLRRDLRKFYVSTSTGEAPSSIVHGLLLWSPIDVPRLAGRLALTIDETRSTIEALEGFGVVGPDINVATSSKNSPKPYIISLEKLLSITTTAS